MDFHLRQRMRPLNPSCFLLLTKKYIIGIDSSTVLYYNVPGILVYIFVFKEGRGGGGGIMFGIGYDIINNVYQVLYYNVMLYSLSCLRV